MRSRSRALGHRTALYGTYNSKIRATCAESSTPLKCAASHKRLAHFGLGRAYALQGDTAEAHMAYRDFFAFWRGADPNIPIPNEAKAEYAKPTMKRT
jgi:hypothetical protein